jgi:hypothetical protein
MKKLVLLLGCFLCGTANATPHKCEINGKIIFQDAPCTGEIKSSESISETGARELFEKVYINELIVKRGQKNGEYTEISLEVMATNNTKNKIQLILKYDGLDDGGLVVDTETLIGNIDNNSNKKITNGFLKSKRTAILNKIVKWRFNSWKSTIN